MLIAIVTAGTEGDIQPMLAIGRGLRARGHDVRFAASPDHHDLVKASGLEPFALGRSARHVVADIARSNPRRSRLKTLRRALQASVPREEDLDGYVRACQGADAVVYMPISGLAYHVADSRGVPAFEVTLFPLTPTRAFPSPHAPTPRGFGPAYNWLSHHAVHEFFWTINRAWVNDWRRRALGAPALPWRGPPATRYFREKRTVLCTVSPAVVPYPSDWPDNVRMTGYLFASSEGYVPPEALNAFVHGGDPPVTVGFGSTIEGDPKTLLPILAGAREKTGRRFVFVKGWANYELPGPSEHTFIADRVSYAWLYPRSAAVVHHAGTGTAAEAVRAGVPSICVPYIAEQRFWAARLTALEAAPQAIPRRALNADALARAIDDATGSARMRERAQALGAAVRAEDGLTNALNAIERRLSR